MRARVRFMAVSFFSSEEAGPVPVESKNSRATAQGQNRPDMAKIQRAQTVVVEPEQPRKVKCQHRNRKYVINQVEFKIWRCLDCGLLQKEE